LVKQLNRAGWFQRILKNANRRNQKPAVAAVSCMLFGLDCKDLCLSTFETQCRLLWKVDLLPVAVVLDRLISASILEWENILTCLDDVPQWNHAVAPGLCYPTIFDPMFVLNVISAEAYTRRSIRLGGQNTGRSGAFLTHFMCSGLTCVTMCAEGPTRGKLLLEKYQVWLAS